MVRAGIIAYGYYPSEELERVIEPEQAFTLHTSVTNLHTVHTGETVSYGRTFTAHRETLVATIPIGYGDGYRRSLSNTGFVLIGGRRAPVIGRVCMDQTMVDVTDCEGAAVGSEAVLIGRQGGEAIWADELAQWCGTISYEIMLGITQRVRRKYIDI